MVKKKKERKSRKILIIILIVIIVLTIGVALFIRKSANLVFNPKVGGKLVYSVYTRTFIVGLEPAEMRGNVTMEILEFDGECFKVRVKGVLRGTNVTYKLGYTARINRKGEVVEVLEAEAGIGGFIEVIRRGLQGYTLLPGKRVEYGDSWNTSLNVRTSIGKGAIVKMIGQLVSSYRGILPVRACGNVFLAARVKTEGIIPIVVETSLGNFTGVSEVTSTAYFKVDTGVLLKSKSRSYLTMFIEGKKVEVITDNIVELVEFQE